MRMRSCGREAGDVKRGGETVVLKMRAAGVGLAMVVGALAAPAWGQAPGVLNAQSPPLTAAEAAALKNPVPFTNANIAAGKTLYLSNNCASCHGPDGKALVDVLGNATDLTDPKFWLHGAAPGQVFKSIRDGAGPSMPPYKGTINKEEDLWKLVIFIQSLWPADAQPPKQ